MATLLLNADYQPLKIIGWKEAVLLHLDNKVIVVKEGKKVIRSQFITVQVPEVMALKEYVKVKKQGIRVSRNYIFYRDGFECQYCGKKPTSSLANLTLDHVVPKSKGGPRTKGNLVAACKKCNVKKANRTPKEAGMKLIHPIRKDVYYSITRYKIAHLYPEWSEYL